MEHQRSAGRSVAPRARAVRAFETGFGRARFVPEIVAIVVMTTVLLFVRAQFADMVAPALLYPWLGFMACCVLARVWTLGAASRSAGWRQVSPLFRVRAGQAITACFSAGIVASVWILMPPADDLLRLVMIILCMWFIAMVIILNADRLSVLGALAVVGSMASFAIVYDLPYALALAGFLVMEGAALIMIRRIIARSAEALEAALAIVQAERDAKTRFIASASHDLQQPLHAARLYVDQVLTGEDATIRARAAAGARSAFASTERLLESMLDHLRLEADAMPVRPAPLALDAVLRAVATEHEPFATAAGMRIMAIGREVQAIADEHLFRRAIGNLLANALRHSGGNRIVLVARRRGERAEIWILDNGEGVAPTDTGRLFDDYFQGTRDGARRVGGFGLGLASARRMAMLMGGSLDLDPRWTRGCAFVLRLPIDGPHRNAA